MANFYAAQRAGIQLRYQQALQRQGAKRAATTSSTLGRGYTTVSRPAAPAYTSPMQPVGAQPPARMPGANQYRPQSGVFQFSQGGQGRIEYENALKEFRAGATRRMSQSGGTTAIQAAGEQTIPWRYLPTDPQDIVNVAEKGRSGELTRRAGDFRLANPLDVASESQYGLPETIGGRNEIVYALGFDRNQSPFRPLGQSDRQSAGGFTNTGYLSEAGVRQAAQQRRVEWANYGEGKAEAIVAEQLGRVDLGLGTSSEFRRFGEKGEGAVYFARKRDESLTAGISDETITQFSQLMGQWMPLQAKLQEDARTVNADKYQAYRDAKFTVSGINTEFERKMAAANAAGIGSEGIRSIRDEYRAALGPAQQQLSAASGQIEQLEAPARALTAKMTELLKDTQFRDAAPLNVENVAQQGLARFVGNLSDKQLGLMVAGITAGSGNIYSNSDAQQAIADMFETTLGKTGTGDVFRVERFGQMEAEQERLPDVLNATLRLRQSRQGTIDSQRAAAEEAAMQATYRSNRHLLAGRLLGQDSSLLPDLISGNSRLREALGEDRYGVMRSTNPFITLANMQSYGSAASL